MKYELKGKIINIPDKDIETFVNSLNITKEEAIEMWLDDNDYTINETVEELTDKAKKNIKRYEHSDKERKKTTRERKVDEEKKGILEILSEALNNQNIPHDTKNEAEISFCYGENNYTVKLIKHRKPKN